MPLHCIWVARDTMPGKQCTVLIDHSHIWCNRSDGPTALTHSEAGRHSHLPFALSSHLFVCLLLLGLNLCSLSLTDSQYLVCACSLYWPSLAGQINNWPNSVRIYCHMIVHSGVCVLQRVHMWAVHGNTMHSALHTDKGMERNICTERLIQWSVWRPVAHIAHTYTVPAVTSPLCGPNRVPSSSSSVYLHMLATHSIYLIDHVCARIEQSMGASVRAESVPVSTWDR